MNDHAPGNWPHHNPFCGLDVNHRGECRERPRAISDEEWDAEHPGVLRRQWAWGDPLQRQPAIDALVSVGYPLSEADQILGQMAKDIRAYADPQPSPTEGTGKPIWPMVIEDMRARHNLGWTKYGTPLKAFNGRDALVDAYQEALDLCVYLRQAIEERTAA